jgi:hypothetical protein
MHTSSTTRVTRGGRVQRFKILVVGGNQEGLASYGIGKAETVPFAMQKAQYVSLSLSLSLSQPHSSHPPLLLIFFLSFFLLLFQNSTAG